MLTPKQIDQLLKPIHPSRVLRDGKGMSHVSQQDVLAHLTRVFGFGNWTTDLVACELLFESPRDPDKTGARDRWDVAYRAQVRLTIKDVHGEYIAHYEDASTGDAINQSRADAHDLAMKSAISLAKKRCAIHLGDQFGLSLYNKGQMAGLVIGLIEDPRNGTPLTETRDVQTGVPQQESLGIDETVYSDGRDTSEPTAEQEAVLSQSLGATRIGTETTQG